jgi:hypothetical protein
MVLLDMVRGCVCGCVEECCGNFLTEMSVERCEVSVRMYTHTTIVYVYIRIPKIWEMSARADTNCHDISNFVSATRTHLAKIGATRCVVADMSRHVGDISS